MSITIDQLHQIMPYAKSKLEIYFSSLVNAMAEFDIDSKLRQAAFIAQIAHESGEFRYAEEIASGAAYEGRKDLGNTLFGDGVKFKGRGLIQITGRTNYEALRDNLLIDCIEHPEIVKTPENACRSAAWFWKKHSLNELADSQNFALITRRINGGLNGLASRQKYYDKALEVL